MTRLRRLTESLRGCLRQRPVGDTFTFQIGQVVTIAVQALTSLIVLRVLGPGQFGVYALATALVAAVGVLDLTGANRLALTEIAHARGAGADERIAPSLAAFLRTTCLVRLPLVVGVFTLAPAAVTAVYGDPQVGRLVRWLVLPMVLGVPYDLVILLLHGGQRIRDVVRVETTRAVLVSAAICLALLTGWGLSGLVAMRVGASVVAGGWAIRRYTQLAADMRFLPSWAGLLQRGDTVRTASHLRAGAPMAIEKALGNLGSQIPVLMLGALHPGAVGYYSAAARLMALPAPLVSAVARNLDVMLPFRAGKGTASLRHAFSRATMWSGGLWMLVTLVTASGAPILLIWFAGEVYRPALPVIYPLALQSLAVGAGVGISAALRTIDKARYGAALQAASLALTLPIGVVLVERLEAVGAGWFHALRYVLVTVTGIATVLWALRDRRPR